MKKFLAVLFAALMLFSAVSLPVFADGEAPQTEPTRFYLTAPVYSREGSEVSVYLNVEGEYEAHIVSLFVTFDPDCAEFIGYEKMLTSNPMVSAGLTMDGDEVAFGLFVISGAPFSQTGTIARFDFRMLEGAPENAEFGIRMQMFRYREPNGSPIELECTLEGASFPVLRADEAIPAPTITLENVPETGYVKVSWNEVPFAEKYQVYRSAEKGGTYKLMKTTTGLSYINTSAKPGETWYYKVRAVTVIGENGKYSSAKYRTTDLPRPVVTGGHVAATGKNRLTWEAVPGAKEYKIYRADAKDGEYTLKLTTSNLSYVNTGSVAGETYYYYVVAVHENTSANSAPSLTKTLTCDLAAPVVKLSYTSAGKPKLSWAAIDGAKEYKVYRCETKTGQYKLLKTTTNLTFTNTSVASGETYYYKVMAIHEKSAANSAYSAVVTATGK